MHNKTRDAEDSIARKLYQNEISLVHAVFWNTSSVADTLGEDRPLNVSDEDVLVATDLVRSIRARWNGAGEEETLYGATDDLIDLHPEIIPWLQEFLNDGMDGEHRFFELIQYAHRIVFQ